MVLNHLGMSRVDQKLQQGHKLVEGGPVGTQRECWSFQSPHPRGWTGTLKMGVIYFGFKQYFLPAVILPWNKRKTWSRLPTHCIIHYPCPRGTNTLEWDRLSSVQRTPQLTGTNLEHVGMSQVVPARGNAQSCSLSEKRAKTWGQEVEKTIYKVG